MRRYLAVLVSVLPVVVAAPAPAVVDGRGSVVVAGTWTPPWPHVPEATFTVAIAASNEPAVTPPCPGIWGCPPQGVVEVQSTTGFRYRGEVTCLWVQQPHVYIGVIGGSGDAVRPGAAYVSSGVFDPGEPDAFALLEERPFDCEDETLREELRANAGVLRHGRAVVVPRCPPVFVCPAD